MRLAGFLIVTFILSSAALLAVPVKAAPSYLNISASWLGTVHSGCDPYYTPSCSFYGGGVNAYKPASNATLVVTVGNPYPGNASTTWFISAVKVFMDWGTNYTSKQATTAAPVTLTTSSTKIFTISFTVPDISAATNVLVHNYQVIIEFISGPNGTPQGASTQSGSGFVVYSQDQVAVWALMSQLGLSGTLGSTIGLCGPVGAGPYGTISQRTFTTPEANSLCLQASREVNVAMASYQVGNFLDAKTHLQNAVAYWNQAIAAESSSPSYANFGSVVMNILVGVGVSLGGVAAIIYSLKRFHGTPVATPKQVPLAPNP